MFTATIIYLEIKSLALNFLKGGDKTWQVRIRFSRKRRKLMESRRRKKARKLRVIHPLQKRKGPPKLEFGKF